MRLLLLLLMLSFQLSAQRDYAQYVDPFIGTGGHGHTFPGPTLPFGMVQLSPDTRLSGWDGCSGYHYSDNLIYGFSHTHLSGTGCSDYGDILLMPTTGKVQVNNKKYSSTFKKESEKASAGYYTVYLDKPKVKVELTTTTRTGLHKYTFSKAGSSNIILDLTHRDFVKSGEINITGNNEISGMRISKEWANNQILYFVIQFSKPFANSGIAKADARREGAKHDTGSLLKAFATFETTEGEVIYAKVGISAVSVEGARENLLAEQPGFDFDKTLAAAKEAWNKELARIDVESKDASTLRNFYTALYHAMIAPNTYSDVNNKFRGRDFEVHEAKGFNYYTVFSLWDTYRALHPLLTIIDRKRTGDFVNTFVTQFEQGGRLPVWELSSCETWCMIGYHAVPVITDAYLKGITSFDAAKAYDAMKFSAMEDRNGLKSYKANGYIQQLDAGENVSRTLEYAYDDWCIAMAAKKLGKTEDYNYFIKRAQNYKNLYDPSTGFMRPRNGAFMSPFDPYKVDHNYTEGNAWQYSFYVPQDISGQMKLLGGKEKLASFLDTLFTTSSKLTGHKQPDISGMIGQYVHGNEPSHQIAYEYNYAGQPWKTQAMVRRIMNEMYHDKPDGLSGNEDCGQMSAWYIFSALGFYPVCPGSEQYAIGSPVVDKASIHLENGNHFSITVNDNQPKNVYISSVKLNGSDYAKSYLTYTDITNGGTLEINMSAEPNKNWGSGEGDVPVQGIE
ncbi:MAG TPA: GH92 family glycosyl hydrolase [Chitinophagales bacterium]|nr:GH92 family glycosyl hydrolase [Chitinophagales bacterium]